MDIAKPQGANTDFKSEKYPFIFVLSVFFFFNSELMSLEKAHGHDCGCIKDNKEDSFGVNMLKADGRKMNRDREKNARTNRENDQVDRLEPSV